MGSGLIHLQRHLLLLLITKGLLLTGAHRPHAAGLLMTPPALLGCDFDDTESPFCDWTQPEDTSGKWHRDTGQKPGESPGPPGGSPERRGYYIYPEAGESVLQSPKLNPAASDLCVEFLYYLYSLDSKGRLAVRVQDAAGNATTVWTRNGMQSSAWLLGTVTVQSPVQRPFQVVFVATQGSTKEVTLALDSLSVRLGPCSPCETGCDFDDPVDICGWESFPEGNTEWIQWNGPGDEAGVGPSDDFSKPGFGQYMLLTGINSPGSALLKSPPEQSLGGCLSLSFHYTLHGITNDTRLDVYAAASEDDLGSPLLTLRGEHGPDWQMGAVNYTGTAEIQFVFKGVYGGKPGLAVDSVRISPCEEIFTQCDFNDNADPFCGWPRPADNTVSWIRMNGTTPTEETGPPGDYPSGEGYYVYVESGTLKPGQSASLSTRSFCTDTDACVEFYYYMYGIVEVETQLRVLVQGPSGTATLLWSLAGIQSPRWLLGSVTVPYGGAQPSKVIFEVVRGSNPYLDVALDNISVRRGACTGSGTPTPPSSPSTSTISTSTTRPGPIIGTTSAGSSGQTTTSAGSSTTTECLCPSSSPDPGTTTTTTTIPTTPGCITGVTTTTGTTTSPGTTSSTSTTTTAPGPTTTTGLTTTTTTTTTSTPGLSTTTTIPVTATSTSTTTTAPGSTTTTTTPGPTTTPGLTTTTNATSGTTTGATASPGTTTSTSTTTTIPGSTTTILESTTTTTPGLTSTPDLTTTTTTTSGTTTGTTTTSTPGLTSTPDLTTTTTSTRTTTTTSTTTTPSITTTTTIPGSTTTTILGSTTTIPESTTSTTPGSTTTPGLTTTTTSTTTTTTSTTTTPSITTTTTTPGATTTTIPGSTTTIPESTTSTTPGSTSTPGLTTTTTSTRTTTTSTTTTPSITTTTTPGATTSSTTTTTPGSTTTIPESTTTTIPGSTTTPGLTTTTTTSTPVTATSTTTTTTAPDSNTTTTGLTTTTTIPGPTTTTTPGLTTTTTTPITATSTTTTTTAPDPNTTTGLTTTTTTPGPTTTTIAGSTTTGFTTTTTTTSGTTTGTTTSPDTTTSTTTTPSITTTTTTTPGSTTTPGLTTTTTSGTTTSTSTTTSPGTTSGITVTSTRTSVPPPDQESCVVSGDPHYTTYDGRLFHFMGTCTYLLSAPCSNTSGLPSFTVAATNEHRGNNKQVSYVRSVRVEVYGTQIVLLKSRRVTVDGQRVTLPISVADGRVSVQLSGTFVLLRTDFHLKVRFDGNHHVDVSAPSSYSGQLCGLCGNYNGQPGDDNLTPDGTSAKDDDELGESWQIPDAGDSGCTNSGEPGACDPDISSEAQKPTSCGILKDPQGPFSPCHSKIPPEGAFDSCYYDLCGTEGDTGSLCFALQSYADRCAQAGITMTWRNSSFCPLNCPAGSTYTSCGPACPATCANPDVKDSCPNLPCVEGCVCNDSYVLSGEQCVPLSQCGCTDSNGHYHMVGDSWMGNSNCTSRCTCASQDKITCEEWSCSPIQECRPQEGLLGCQDTGVAACHVAGDPHYYTFDGNMVSFMGTCTYTLVQMCHPDPRLPSFSITAKNEERGQPEASYLRLVTVEVGGATITLQKGRRVLIDGQRVRTPVEGHSSGVTITTSGIYVVLETNFGLVVKFDGNHHLEIQLPGTYFDKVCGMCGNFNNQSQDDLLMPNGLLAANDSEFGNSWKASGDADPGCQPDNREDLAPSCSAQEMERLRALCQEILLPKYQPCHGVIDPQPFLQNCLFDMCEYQGMASVLCDNIQAYVEACKSQGVEGLSWRNSTFCPLPCPAHSHYTECSAPCPATCSNLYAPASCQRPTTCVEGCACDRGYVLSDDTCVLMRDCGCVDKYHEYHSPGDSWVTGGCGERCVCAGNGKIICQDFTCLPGSLCALSSTGLHYCRPSRFHQCVISGDPHYRTFDSFVHHFQGRATYTLTRTLDTLPGSLEALSVAGRNLRRFPLHRFSFLREVYVSVYGYSITLMQGRKMTVNGRKVTPPYYPRDGLQIIQRGRSLLVQTDFGFTVSFDGRDFAEIVLPSTYQNYVGGLCGNYDGRRNNEYMRPDGTWTRSLDNFGNSWQVQVNRAITLERKTGSHVRTRREEEPVEEPESGFEMACSQTDLAFVNGTEACGALSDPQGPFAACHSAVLPSTFQESCVYDLCALFNDTTLLCQNYEAYAQLCQEEGVLLESWRKKTHCEMSCPAHSSYKACMTACPASCANMAAPSDCDAPCVEGCASDPGYILSGLESVPYNQCGCTRNNQYYQIGDTFFTEDCSEHCTCLRTGTLECKKAGCSQGLTCTVANYSLGCFRESACLSNPCQNEGTCQDLPPEGFLCLCLEGYMGPLCQEVVADPIPPPAGPDSNLTAILVGVLVPLGLIVLLALVVTVCVCWRKKHKSKLIIQDDKIAVISHPDQYGASNTPGNNAVRF